MIDLTKLDRLKDNKWIKILSTSDKYDSFLGQLITAMSLEAEKFMGRKTKEESQTDFFDIRKNTLRLKANGYPVNSGQDIKVYWDYLRAFAADTELDSERYFWDYENGVLFLKTYLAEGFRIVKVTYTGGMATDTDDFISKYPDIANAVDEQVAMLFQRRDELGLKAAGLEGGSLQMFQNIEWLPGPKSVLMMNGRIF